jgi:hypothetical protein
VEVGICDWKGTTWKKCTKRMVSRNKKYEENIRFPFLYFTVAATNVGYVSNIDIQRGKRCFTREQTGKNAPNSWFSGPKKMRRKIRFSFLYLTMVMTKKGSQEEGQDTNRQLFLWS